MEQIINQLTNNFDFALMFVINVVTYGIIKCIDDINGDKAVTTWQKRIVFIITAFVLGVIYKQYADINTCIIINSCIIAPVAWSWFAKPIATKLGIDYKKNINIK